jgi:hypothetical protein
LLFFSEKNRDIAQMWKTSGRSNQEGLAHQYCLLFKPIAKEALSCCAHLPPPKITVNQPPYGAACRRADHC